jgi:ring-1,2-phenylacetyl-CoA epoxidase subunit PaaC
VHSVLNPAPPLRGRAAATAPGRGRDGEHTPALTEILAELQGLARAIPDGAW